MVFCLFCFAMFKKNCKFEQFPPKNNNFLWLFNVTENKKLLSYSG